MAKVIQLHVWMQNRRKTWTESEVQVSRFRDNKKVMVPHPGKRIVLDIETDNITQMKLAVAKVVKEYEKQLGYYYVVAVVQRDDGEIGYRTIVRKTVIR